MTPTPNTQTALAPASAAPAPAKRKEVSALLETNKAQFQRALGSAVPADFFMRVALTSINKSPLLAISTPESLMLSLMDCAQIRLVPDGILGEAYLVPFFNGKLKAYEAKLMIGYKGYIKLVRRNAEVRNIAAEVVYANDQFTCRYGTKRELTHEPLLAGERGAPIGAYAYIEYQSGGADFRFTEAAYIDRVMRSSQGWEKQESPWQVWWESMWCKTAIRQLVKTADLSPETREALNKDLDAGAIDISASVKAAQASAAESSLAREARELSAATPAALPEGQPAQENEAKPAAPTTPAPGQSQQAAAPKRGPGRPPKSAQQAAAPAAHTPPQVTEPASLPAATPPPAPPAPRIGSVPPPPPRRTAAPQPTAEELKAQNEALLREMGIGPKETGPSDQEEPPVEETAEAEPDATESTQAEDQNIFPE